MPDPILWIEAENPGMVKAIHAAQETFSEFARLAELENFRVIYAYGAVAIKAFFADPSSQGRGEHIFLTRISTNRESVTATLNSDPQFESPLREQDEVTFPVANLSDWFLVVEGEGIGGFTIDVMWQQFSKKQREQYLWLPPFVWYRDRLLSGGNTQSELDSVPRCEKCGRQELHRHSYHGTICGICSYSGMRCDCATCGAPLIRFPGQPHQCYRCQKKVEPRWTDMDMGSIRHFK